MPYIKCPTCEKVGHAVAVRRMPDLCRHCGDPLPLRRTVIPISLHRRLADDLDARSLVAERPIAA